MGVKVKVRVKVRVKVTVIFRPGRERILSSPNPVEPLPSPDLTVSPPHEIIFVAGGGGGCWMVVAEGGYR